MEHLLSAQFEQKLYTSLAENTYIPACKHLERLDIQLTKGKDQLSAISKLTTRLQQEFPKHKENISICHDIFPKILVE